MVQLCGANEHSALLALGYDSGLVEQRREFGEPLQILLMLLDRLGAQNDWRAWLQLRLGTQNRAGR